MTVRAIKQAGKSVRLCEYGHCRYPAVAAFADVDRALHLCGPHAKLVAIMLQRKASA